jgi:hypothetical protein
MLNWRAIAPWLLMGLTVLVFALGFWPGHMNNDSLAMIGQARGTYELDDHHAPVLIWLWKIAWPLLRPGTVLVLQVSAVLLGGYLVARAAFGRLAAALVSIAACLSPPVFGNLGVISRDTWFLGFLMLAFGFLVLAARSPERRKLGLWGALVFSVLTMFARQNAAAAVIVVAVGGFAILLGSRFGERGRLIRWGAPLAAGVAAIVLALGFQLGATKATGAKAVHPEQYLYLYDLAGLSVRDGADDFPLDVYAGDVATLDQESSLDTIIPLSFGDKPAIPMPRPDSQVAEMRDAWWDQVTDDPGQYLGWRWDAFMKQIGITSPGVFIYHPGIDPNAWGYKIAFPGLNDIATGYQELFADQYLNGHKLQLAWFYLLLAICAAIVLLVAGGPALIVGALALSTWTYQVGLFFGTMGTQWRFEYPVALISLICVAVAAKVVWDRGRRPAARRSEPAELSPADEPRPAAAAPTATASS